MTCPTTYRVYNRTRGLLLATEAGSAESLWARLRGLIGRSKQQFDHGKGLWIISCNGVHTIGMSFPLDVVYLDSSLRVIRLYRGLRPNRIAAISPRARSVLELPEGTLEQAETQIGDVLEFLPDK